jgi:integrase
LLKSELRHKVNLSVEGFTVPVETHSIEERYILRYLRDADIESPSLVDLINLSFNLHSIRKSTGTHLSPRTVNNRLSAIIGLVNRAQSSLRRGILAGRIAGNESAIEHWNELSRVFQAAREKILKNRTRISPTVLSNSSAMRRLLSQEEVRDLIHNADPETAIIIRILYFTGARISELLNIRYSDIELDGDIYFINLAGKARRRVFLCVEYYRELMSVFPPHDQIDEYVFVNSKGQRVNRTTVVARMKSSAAKCSGELSFVSPGVIRSSFASLMLKIDAMTIEQLSSYLGHSTLTVTYQLISDPYSSGGSIIL